MKLRDVIRLIEADCWRHHHALLPEIRRLADSAFDLLKKAARHPSLQIKKLVDIGLFMWDFIIVHYRSKKRINWFGSGSATTQNMIG